MKNELRILALAGMLVGACGFHAGEGAVKVGEPAPDFALLDSNGAERKLADFKGKIVVLEWHNHECPYVRKHYAGGNIPKLQREFTGKGIAWLSIISSAQGKQGYVNGEQANANMKNAKAAPTHVLLDPKGRVGRLYRAKTTPHMFVIDARGILRYHGAIDGISSADPGDIEKAENYVASALNSVMAGKDVKRAKTKPYGCSVKYAK
ncbi:MAG: alkyl hydroperoxide reductase [Elusimicrobia bacterium RIFCSPLOWO2_12_FULL_59_9]|nr:MAG: alkyl hydroperoxide reductase [Elusimicrobia bacterium RIFCSPLOWO2_12_FULL_59_9]